MVEESSNGVAEVHDLNSILVSSSRDFVVRNNGDQVKVDSLKGKRVGLYFSASWCGPCHRFTPNLVEVYNELLPKNDFEVVISSDEDSESFDEYFAKLRWLAIPFSDSETRDQLDELFGVSGIPHLVIIDENGKVLTDSGVKIIREYGATGYPFSSERIKKLQDQEEQAKREQSLKSILVSHARDYMIVAYGKKVYSFAADGKIDVAEVAAAKVMELECDNDDAFVFMSNVYAAQGRWNDVSMVSLLMKQEKFSSNL